MYSFHFLNQSLPPTPALNSQREFAITSNFSSYFLVVRLFCYRIPNRFDGSHISSLISASSVCDSMFCIVDAAIASFFCLVKTWILCVGCLPLSVIYIDINITINIVLILEWEIPNENSNLFSLENERKKRENSFYATIFNADLLFSCDFMNAMK